MKVLADEVIQAIRANRLLRYTLFISAIVLFLFPAFERFVSYPNFSAQLISSIEKGAIRAGNHLSKSLIKYDLDITDDQIPEIFLFELTNTMGDFQIEKIKIFLGSGKVVFSSDTADIGKINSNDYFHDKVAYGHTFTKVVQKGSKSLEGRIVFADVVETYVPIIKNGKFVGAFEIYYDITAQKAELDKLLAESALVLTAIASGLLIAIFVVIVLAAKEISFRTKVQNNQALINEILKLSLETIPLNGQLEQILERILSAGWLSAKNMGAIFLYDQENQELKMEVQKGLPSALIAKCAKVAMGYCLCGKAAASQRVVFADHNDEMHDVALEGGDSHANYCIPIISSGNLLGVINLYLHAGHQYQPEEENFLASIGDTLVGIIERKKIEEQLLCAKERAEQSDLAKSAFLATMSHEIRTPLNSIIGLNEHLLDIESDSSRRHYLELVKMGGETLLALINDILDLSKIEAGQLELEVAHFDLHGLVRKCAKIIFGRAREKGLVLTVDIAAEIHSGVVGDPQRLKQVLLNLLGNAVKFTESGYVSIEVKYSIEDQLHFIVADSGVGIHADKLETIFAPFTQADDSTTRRYGGTGLGLDICRRLVTLMGGQIWVESKIGQGSQFHFVVRMPKGIGILRSLDRRELERSTRDGALIKPMQILLAEDVEENAVVIQAFLGSTLHKIDIVEDGLQAFEKYKMVRYDLVLMDVQMPVMDGFTATKKIRAWEKEQHMQATPILALTAHAMQEVAIKAIAAGCNMHLSKPIGKERLLDVLHHFASHSERGAIDNSSPYETTMASNPSAIPEAIQSNNIYAQQQNSGQPQHLNLATIDQLREEIGGNIGLPVRRFLENLPDRVRDLAEAIEINSPVQLAAMAHKLKGTAAMMGAEQLTTLCRQLELLGKAGSTPDDGNLLAQLKMEIQDVTEALLAYLQEKDGLQ